MSARYGRGGGHIAEIGKLRRCVKEEERGRKWKGAHHKSMT